MKEIKLPEHFEYAIFRTKKKRRSLIHIGYLITNCIWWSENDKDRHAISEIIEWWPLPPENTGKKVIS